MEDELQHLAAPLVDESGVRILAMRAACVDGPQRVLVQPHGQSGSLHVRRFHEWVEVVVELDSDVRFELVFDHEAVRGFVPASVRVVDGTTSTLWDGCVVRCAVEMAGVPVVAFDLVALT